MRELDHMVSKNWKILILSENWSGDVGASKLTLELRMKLSWGSAVQILGTDGGENGQWSSTERAFSVVFFCFQTIYEGRFGYECIAGSDQIQRSDLFKNYSCSPLIPFSWYKHMVKWMALQLWNLSPLPPPFSTQCPTALNTGMRW